MPLIPRYSTIDTAAVTNIGQCCTGSSEHLISQNRKLNLLPQSEILHAELTWYAIIPNMSDEERKHWPDQAWIHLHTPTGSYQVAAFNSAYIVPRGQTNHSICSASVTTIVREWLSGAYSVSIPIWENRSAILRCGWTLHVIMKHSSLPLQYIQLVTGLEQVTDHKSYYWKLGGFTLPATDNQITLWLCAYNVQALIGEIGPYCSASSPMRDVFRTADSTGIRKLQISTGHITSHSVQDQLLCTVSVKNEEDTACIYAMAAQFDAIGAHIQAHLTWIEECTNEDVTKTWLYRLQLANTGGKIAESIYISIYLSEGVTLLDPSIRIYDNPSASVSCKSGMVVIPFLQPNQTATITFLVALRDMELLQDAVRCIASVIYGIAVASHTYRVRIVSNQVDVPTRIPVPDLTVAHQASTAQAYWQERIAFTVTITPSGHTRLTNVFFRDIACDDCCYVPGTLTINGIPLPADNPLTGFYMEDIYDCEPLVIQYEMEIQQIPPSGQLVTAAQITYHLDRSENCARPCYTIQSDPTIISLRYAQVYTTLVMQEDLCAVGDIVNMDLHVCNGGNMTACKVPIRIPYIVGMCFIEGSVTINGIADTNADPFTGIDIVEINPDTCTCFQFQARIIDTIDSLAVRNQAIIPYEYQVAPDRPLITASQPSNIVLTHINELHIRITEEVDRKYADVGDQLAYTLRISNHGQVHAVDMVVFDMLDPDARIIPGTVKVNGIDNPQCNLKQGYHVGRFTRGAQLVITFLAFIAARPQSGIIGNQAKVTYSYFQQSTGQLHARTSYSNKIKTIIRHVQANLNKAASTRFALPGEVIRFTHHLINTGDMKLDRIWFIDQLPLPLRWIPTSVRINGIPVPKADPLSGFRIRRMPPGTEVRISLIAEVDGVPSNQLVCNTSWVSFTTRYDCCGNQIHHTLESNASCVMIQAAVLDMCMSVDRECVQLGERITCTIELRNAALVPLMSILLRNLIDDSLHFIPESLRINGKVYRTCEPGIDIQLDTLQPGCSHVVIYHCLVKKIPCTRWVLISAEADFDYPLQSTSEVIKHHTHSNIVQIYAFHGNIIVLAAATRQAISLGKPFIMEIAVSNAGTIAADEVYVSASIPEGLRIISGSVQVNGELWSDGHPELRCNIGTILPFTTTKIIFCVVADWLPRTKIFFIHSQAAYQYRIPLQFDSVHGITKASPVLVHACPSLSSCDNQMNRSEIRPAKLNLQLRSERSDVMLHERNRYAVMITNIGHTSAEHVKLVLLIPKEAELIRVFQEIHNDVRALKPLNQIEIGSILPGVTILIEYEVKLFTLPQSNSVIYSAMALYQTDSYSSSVRARTYKSYSNSVITTFQHCNLDVYTTVDEAAASIGEVIHFRTIIRNRGTADATRIRIHDTADSQQWIVTESTCSSIDSIIGTVSTDPELFIEHLEPGGMYIIAHQVEVACSISQALLRNRVQLSFQSVAAQGERSSHHSAIGNEVHVYIKNHALHMESKVIPSIDRNKPNHLLSLSIANVGGGTAYNLMLYPLIAANLRYQEALLRIDDNTSTLLPCTDYVFLPVLMSGQTAIMEYTFPTNEDTIAVPPSPIELLEASATYHYRYDFPTAGYWEHMKMKPHPEQHDIGLRVQTTANRSAIEMEDSISFNIKVENHSSHSLFGLILQVTLPELEWITESAELLSDSESSSSRVVDLGQLDAGGQRCITFSTSTVPSTIKQLICTASIDCYYQPPGTSIIQHYSMESNDAVVQIHRAEIEIHKNIASTNVKCGQYVQVSIQVTNTGSIALTDIWLNESCSPELSCVPGSVIVNDVSCSDTLLHQGSSLGLLDPSEQLRITYLAVIHARPRAGYVTCRTQAGFQYQLQPTDRYRSRTYQSNVMKIYVD